MKCQRTGCGHDRTEHDPSFIGPCNVKNPDGTHCVCYMFLEPEWCLFCGSDDCIHASNHNRAIAGWYQWRNANIPGGE